MVLEDCPLRYGSCDPLLTLARLSNHFRDRCALSILHGGMDRELLDSFKRDPRESSAEVRGPGWFCCGRTDRYVHADLPPSLADSRHWFSLPRSWLIDAFDAERNVTRVLVTGFEPFGGANLNSSKEVVDWLSEQGIPDINLEVLPVEYEASVERILDLISDLDPGIIFALGQAEGRAKVSFERIAINFDDARIPDNAGEHRENQLISDAGPVAHMTNVPVRRIVDELKESGHPVEESLSAGAFVCNHLFYSVLSELQGGKSGKWMDFVHLPLVPEQAAQFPDKPTLAREVQGRAIAAAITTARTLRQG